MNSNIILFIIIIIIIIFYCNQNIKENFSLSSYFIQSSNKTPTTTPITTPSTTISITKTTPIITPTITPIITPTIMPTTVTSTIITPTTVPKTMEQLLLIKNTTIDNIINVLNSNQDANSKLNSLNKIKDEYKISII